MKTGQKASLFLYRNHWLTLLCILKRSLVEQEKTKEWWLGVQDGFVWGGAQNKGPSASKQMTEVWYHTIMNGLESEREVVIPCLIVRRVENIQQNKKYNNKQTAEAQPFECN